MRKARYLLLSFLLLAALTACGPREESEPADATATLPPLSVATATAGGPAAPAVVATATIAGYPPPRPTAVPESYPPQPEPTPTEGYPAPITPQYDESKRFAFDRPLLSGAQEVAGRGFAGTDIKITNISRGGETLATGTVAADGTFRITLSRPLEANETLAIQLGDNVDVTDFLDAPGTDIPMIGLIMDREVVAEP